MIGIPFPNPPRSFDANILNSYDNDCLNSQHNCYNVVVSGDGKAIAASIKNRSNGDINFFIVKDLTSQILNIYAQHSNNYTVVNQISNNGSITAFTTFSQGGAVYNAELNNNTGFNTLFSNQANNEILDISADNRVMVGRIGKKAIKLENNIITELPTINGLDNASYIASAISADGSVIAGYAIGNTGNKFFKYSNNQMVEIKNIHTTIDSGKVNAISGDGSTIVGTTWDAESSPRAFKHNDIGGVQIIRDFAEALDVSFDGKITVGLMGTDSGDHAFKHTDADGIIDLGTLGGLNSEATSITPDGSVIVGLSETGNGDEIQVFILRSQAVEKTPSLVSVENTLKVLNQNANQLNSVLNLKESLLNFNLNQDAKLFGKNNMHFAVGARLGSVDKSQETGGNFKFAYRFSENFRAGIFADYGLNSNLPNNFRANNNIPNTTIFSTISGDTNDSTLFLKLAASFGASDLDITRQTLKNTEAGKGRANLTSKGALAQIGYGFHFANRLKITPYIGVRFSEILRQSYHETSGATFPIDFQKARKKSTTALFGGNLEWQISQNLNSRFGFGFEKDLSVSLDGYKGNISYLGSFDLTPRKIRKNRYVVSSGLTYKITPSQELSVDLQYGKQSLQSSNAIIGYVNYAIGF